MFSFFMPQLCPVPPLIVQCNNIILHRSISRDFGAGFCYSGGNEGDEAMPSLSSRKKVTTVRNTTRDVLHGLMRCPTLGVMVLLMALTACSVPEVDVERKKKHDDYETASPSLQSVKTLSPFSRENDNRYLATVRIRLGDSPASKQVRFDVTRDKNRLVSFHMRETQETLSILHLGYTRSEGAVAGMRFTWRF